jgi:hypothetical protein
MTKKMMKSREFFNQFTYAKTKCVDCGGVNHPYMLIEKTWRRVVLTFPFKHYKDFICLFCAEDRLGRPLEDSDFTNAFINHGCFGFHKDMWTKK